MHFVQVTLGNFVFIRYPFRKTEEGTAQYSFDIAACALLNYTERRAIRKNGEFHSFFEKGEESYETVP